MAFHLGRWLKIVGPKLDNFRSTPIDLFPAQCKSLTFGATVCAQLAVFSGTEHRYCVTQRLDKLDKVCERRGRPKDWAPSAIGRKMHLARSAFPMGCHSPVLVHRAQRQASCLLQPFGCSAKVVQHNTSASIKLTSEAQVTFWPFYLLENWKSMGNL